FGGDFQTFLLIDSNDVNEPQLEVLLKGRGLAPRVCPDPLMLDFGVVTTGSPVIETVVLESCGFQPLRIDDVRLSGDSSSDFELQGLPGFPTTLDPGQNLSVTVQYFPMTDGTDRGSMEIYSNDQSADPVTGFTGAVVIQGRALVSACDISVEPFAVSFGTTTIGESPTVALRISNVGNDTCTLEHVEISTNSANDEFALINGPTDNTSFGPGEVVLMDVQYSPIDRGQDVGTLSIFGNDKDTNEVRVDLNGFGTPGGENPVAVCRVTPTQASSFETLLWDGAGSFDAEAGRSIVDYQWSWFSLPTGSASTMTGTGANRSSQTDMAGEYWGQLIVVNDLGQVSAPCHCMAEVTPSEDLWIELIWQHPGDDMDLHLLAPSGIPQTRTDCYFGNCTPLSPPLDWGVFGNPADDPTLDLDDIPFTGPENINIAHPANGLYTVFVHDYPMSSYNSANEIYVNVYIEGVLEQSFTKTITGEDSNTNICTIDWPSGTITAL
ncbi:MAG: choice-of-anchor D domain-containing protein, partial [Deltaproteobacteria bacterium]|nr:choice-of-anchor D domain-containing protein [Deltaproteobacteria bacterium]